MIELLAPAKNVTTAIAAINHGADAVYMGASSHGARRQAANSVDDIAAVVDYAHKFNVRVYVTVNTIIYDSEIDEVRQLAWDLYRAGVDALIVQDMALLEMHLPPIALHASTQCDIRTPEKARFLQDSGFSQLVLPRELTLDEIAAFNEATSVPLEAFVHGALCVSYSGDCQASFVLTGRSANRGDCAQICRFAYDLEDESGRKIVRGKHLLSLKDMNRLNNLEEMLEAGVSSFKIEGRLKDENYVRNVVAAYSKALDRIVATSNGRYRRRGRGVVNYDFEPDLNKSFNRGYTDYFLHDKRPELPMASVDSPKWVGEPVGVVTGSKGKRVVVARVDKPLANGDGLGFFDKTGKFVGFRLNRFDGDKLFSATDISPVKGDVLYRNSDMEWGRLMERSVVKRRIPIDVIIRVSGTTIIVRAVDYDGIEVSVGRSVELQPASTPQAEYRRKTFAKLGDTIFTLRSFVDEAGDLFIPASVVAELKREVAEAMLDTYKSTYVYDLRRDTNNSAYLPENMKLSRHDNIANRLAEKFYMEKLGGKYGETELPHAIEVASEKKGELRVMQTRYCIRRELGACLKSVDGKKLPSPLFIVSGGNRFRLDFDCVNCRMSVIK